MLRTVVDYTSQIVHFLLDIGTFVSYELFYYQEMIEQSSQLLLSIINNVLDMARVESGKMDLDENYEVVGNIT